MPKTTQTSNNDREDILQAVIVADSFNARFRPLSLHQPRCLLPLLNIPLIEYSLETLASSGIQEIYIVCCAHASQIEDYIRLGKWANSTFPKISIIVSKELRSMGDVLRELDNRLSSDFVLMSGDTVANVDLSRAITLHKERRIKDKSIIMTMLVKEASPVHAARQDSLFFLNSNTHECVFYDPLPPGNRRTKTHLNLHILDAHSQVDIRNDLIDCHVDICSIEVPALFTENFDYQDMRKDFVKGILESDLLGKKFWCHVLKDEYAAKVSCPHMYDVVSKDIMGRWMYPLVPDSNWTADTHYQLQLPSIYREDNVQLANSTRLYGKVLIGQGTTIGKDTVVINSVIGRDCTIGDDVTLNGAYIMQGSKIETGAKIHQSILAQNVMIGPEAIVPRGTLLAKGVRVGEKVELLEFTRWYVNEKGPVSTILGNGGLGVEYEGDSDDQDHDPRKVGGMIGGDPMEKRTSMDEESMEGELTGVTTESDDEFEWLREGQLTLERSFKENHSIDNAALELHTLKMAFNIDFHDLRTIMIPFFMQKVDTSNIKASVREIFGKWIELIKRNVFTTEDQMDVLDVDFFSKSDLPLHVLAYTLEAFYDHDLLIEDVIVKWYHDLPFSEAKVRRGAQDLVNWLQEASSDDDE